MPTIFIEGIVVPLPVRDGERDGDPITDDHAQILNYILHRRVKARLRWLLERKEILPHELQERANQLCAEPLKPYSMLDDTDDDDPVLQEAMQIARELITAKMAEENLPPPKNIDVHAKQVVDNVPQIIEQARKRIEARYRAAQELIGNPT